MSESFSQGSPGSSRLLLPRNPALLLQAFHLWGGGLQETGAHFGYLPAYQMQGGVSHTPTLHDVKVLKILCVYISGTFNSPSQALYAVLNWWVFLGHWGWLENLWCYLFGFFQLGNAVLLKSKCHMWNHCSFVWISFWKWTRNKWSDSAEISVPLQHFLWWVFVPFQHLLWWDSWVFHSK